jgi:NAD(P)H-flavin reductase
VSLIGDTHPVFHGSVVKAIASGMRSYPKIVTLLKDKLGELGSPQEYRQFAERMNYLFKAQVKSVVRKTKDILELTIQAPLAAKHFNPGEFYRLQNFETLALHTDHTLMQMEPLALVTSEHDSKQGTLTFIVSETNASAKLCASLKPGESVSLMGPTGVRAKIPTERETVLIVGTQTSFAFLRSYGPIMRAAGNRVMYLGIMEHKEEVYCQSQLENATDVILWLTKQGECVKTKRIDDYAVTSNDAIAALLNYDCANNPRAITLADVDRIFVVGDTDLLRLFQAARKTLLKDHLLKDPKVFGSVYGSMQCMLKGVCAQCLQWQIDPETGERTKAVFACSWQDQPLEIIDIDHIDARQLQNQLSNQLTNLWIDYVFTEYGIARI